MVYSNLLFIIFFVVLIINCVSLPNLAICSSIYICNISIFVLAILFMIFTNLFSDKLFPKLNFQSLPGLSLTNLIFLSLLCFYFTIKNMKAKVKKIQILSSRAIHSVAAIYFF